MAICGSPSVIKYVINVDVAELLYIAPAFKTILG